MSPQLPGCLSFTMKVCPGWRQTSRLRSIILKCTWERNFDLRWWKRSTSYRVWGLGWVACLYLKVSKYLYWVIKTPVSQWQVCSLVPALRSQSSKPPSIFHIASFSDGWQACVYLHPSAITRKPGPCGELSSRRPGGGLMSAPVLLVCLQMAALPPHSPQWHVQPPRRALEFLQGENVVLPYF